MAETSEKPVMDVNFHQNKFDTDERYWRFMLNQGSFFEYLVNRTQWFEYPRNYFVSDFPLHVDVETTNTCNMTCPMCFRGDLEDQGQMELKLFKKIIDECEKHGVFSVRLSWRGEPLTHPDIKEMITYATERINNVSFITNAYYLFDDMIDLLIDNQVAYISASFDGLGEIYNQIRRPAIYEESYQKLKNLQKRKKEKRSKRPQLRVCALWPSVKDNPAEYQKAMSNVADYMVSNPYKNFKTKPDPKPNFICQYPWERIMIAWNGQTQCCTGWNAPDIALGNVAEKSIYDMWHSDKLEYIRKMHRENRRLEIHGCLICRHGNVFPDQNISIQEIIKRGY